MEPLSVPGDLESLATIRRYVNEAADRARLEKSAAYNLSLAVDEIATNIITHGYQETGTSGTIVLRVEETEEELLIILEDTGPPFDPRSHMQPGEEELSKPLEERQVGGMGIYFARQSVHRFDYERVDGTNRNIFVMQKPS